MIPLVSSKVLLVSFPWRNLAFSSSPTHFILRSNFTPISQTRLFSSIHVAKEVDKNSSSSASEKLVSKHVQIKDPSNPDSVPNFLKNYGFSDAHIQKIITSFSQVLNMKVEKNLKPKMEFFLSIGAQGEDLTAIVCRNPSLLGCSLNKKILPCYEFFKRVLVHDELVVKSLKFSSCVWTEDLETNVVPNFELLKKVGVPESNIQTVLTRYCGLLRLDNAEFSQRVNKVISMGFDPSKYSFSEAIRCWPTKSNWERKAQAFRNWGWSESDISFAYKKNPTLMQTSMEKITVVMDFLVNKMGWNPSAVAVFPYVFFYSLEKNIIPKCSVIRVLMLKGLIGEEIALTCFLSLARKSFLDRFVFKYLQQVPELLDIFEGEVDLEELGYGFEGKLDTKLEQLVS